MSRRGMLVSFGLLAVTLAATLGYGASRLRAPILAEGPSAKVAIIQGSIDTLFPTSAEEDLRYWESIETQYRELTQSCLRSWDLLT